MSDKVPLPSAEGAAWLGLAVSIVAFIAYEIITAWNADPMNIIDPVGGMLIGLGLIVGAALGIVAVGVATYWIGLGVLMLVGLFSKSSPGVEEEH